MIFPNIITEFYQECKQKTRVKSYALRALIVKLRSKSDEDDLHSGLGKFSIPDSVLNWTQDPEDTTPLSNKRKPTRRQPLRKSNLKDIL